MDDLLSRIESIKDASTIAVINLAKEYGTLASLSTLSDQQQLRLQEIFELAAENEVLDFWITEIDHVVGHELGILDKNARADYQNQQALLREHLGDVIAKNTNNMAIDEDIFHSSNVK